MNCERCGKEYVRRANEVHQRYCSEACRLAARKKQYTEQVCRQCGQTFTPTDGRGGAVTCSVECSIAYNRDRNRVRRQQTRHTPRKSYEGEAFVTIVKDPIPVDEGGYRPGSVLPSQHFDLALSMGYMSDGMVVIKKNVRMCVHKHKLETL